MFNQDERLVRCFESVFPGLTTAEIRTSGSEHGAWDSLSLVTLVAVVQEEFGLEVGPEDLAALDSYGAFQSYIGRLQGSGK